MVDPFCLLPVRLYASWVVVPCVRVCVCVCLGGSIVLEFLFLSYRAL